MDSFILAYDALLRPARFSAFLEGGWRNIRRAAIATLLWLGVALAFVGLVLPQLLAVGAQGLAAGLVLAPALSLMIAAFGVMLGSGGRSTSAHVAFWLLRCQVTITPPLALFLTLVFSRALTPLQRSPLMVLLLLLLLGMWLGGGLTVLLILRERQDETAAVRWVVAGGALVIGAALWWSMPLRASPALFFVPFCAGLAAGVIRPLSYLWEAPLSLALALAARLGAAPLRLLPLHPANYDDLCLLPLPGLDGLLARGCAANLEAGGQWLLRIGQPVGQRRAVERAINRIVRQGQLTHPLLFWLSTSDEGIAVLRTMAGREQRSQALINAYAAFAETTIPDAWPAVLEQHQAALTRAVALPGGQAVLALLDAGAGALRADRWPDALARLGAALAPEGVAPDPIWDALASIRAWAGDAAPAEIADRAAAVRSLVGELDDLEGWPIALIAAMCEHLLFLIGVERRRGAWLV